jgi:DNA modification methylase
LLLLLVNARIAGEHPTIKPTLVFEIPIEQHTNEGDMILEPLSGSGTSLIAAEKLGRRYRAIEISPAFVDVAIRRWEKATGKEAWLESGATYEAVKAQRLSVPRSTAAPA